MLKRAMASITFLPGLMVLIFGLFHLSDGFQIRALGTVRNCAHHKPSASVNKNDSDVPAESTLDVIKKCMGQSVPSQTTDSPLFLQMRPGISGFAVDPELGFVAVLTKGGKTTSVVVSTEDTLEVRSAEGLCLVQLAGGMDLGTGILPPDALAQLVADELEVSKEDIRPKLRLLEVRAVLNDMLSSGSSSRDVVSEVPPSTPERDFKLEGNVVKLLESVKKLPGLGRCTKDQVMDAMKAHADADGAIDRMSFMDILHTLRLKNISSEDASRIRFEMVISLDDEKKESVAARSSLLALGLAMRYGIEVEVSDECLEYDALDIASKFPKFRPMQELEEDAKLMEGFIPSMYSKVAGSLKADDRA